MRRLILWLTMSRRCAWCNPKQTLHRAWFHRDWSDTICEAHMDQQRENLRRQKLEQVKPIQAQL